MKNVNEILTIEDAMEYVSIYPKLKTAYETLARIEALESEAVNEDDDIQRECLLQRIRVANNCFRKNILEFMTEHDQETLKKYDDLSNRYEAIVTKLQDALKKEREENGQILTGLTLAIIDNPNETIQSMLNMLKRNIDIENPGDGWKYSLEFGLIARLKMAYKIIFGMR